MDSAAGETDLARGKAQDAEGQAADGGRERSRTLILIAAERLIIEEGLQAATIRRIADEAGVNSALTRYYFGSTEGLQLELARLNLAPILTDWKVAPESSQGLDMLVRGYISPMWNPAAFNPAERALSLLDELSAHGGEKVREAVARPMMAQFDYMVEEIRFLRHGISAEEIAARLAFACAGALGMPPRSRSRTLFAGRPGRHTSLEESVAFAVALMRMPQRG